MKNPTPSQGSVSIGSTINLTTTASGTGGVISNRTFNMSPFKTMCVTWNAFGPTSTSVGLIHIYMEDVNKKTIYWQESKNKINSENLIINVDISDIKEQAFVNIRSYSSRSGAGGRINKIEFLL